MMSAQVGGQENGGVIKDDGQEEDRTQAQEIDQSLFLDDGEKHEVWTPPPPSLPAGSIQGDSAAETIPKDTAQIPRVSLHELRRKDILERRKELMNRVKATQKLLRLQSEQHERDHNREQERQQLTPRQRQTWQGTLRDDGARAKRRELNLKTMRPFHEAVSEMAKYCETKPTHPENTQQEAVQRWTMEYQRMASNIPVLEQETPEVEDTAM